MTEKQVPGQLTREEAKNYILLTLDRFRVMTLHLNDNRSKLPSILNENKEILDLVYELEARNFYIDLMHLYLSDIFEVLSSEGYKEFLLKCKSISEKFCLKVKIPTNITVVGEDIVEQFISELTEESLKRIRNNLQEVEETRNLLLSQVQDVKIDRINKNELETIISKRQEYEIAKKNHNQANHQIQILASSHCTDENAYKPYYKICEENKKIMDTILCDYPLVQYFKNKTEEAYLKRQITKTFDDINDAINKIINKIIEGKYPIWHFDSLISELLQKYSSNEAQIIKQQLEDMKKKEDFKDLFLTIGSITLSVLTLLIPGGVIAGLLRVKSGLQIANAAFSVASAINDIEDSVLYRQEVLSHIKVSPEVQELMNTENISLTDAQIQLLVALLSSTFVIFDLSDAKKSVDLLRKLDNLDNEAVQALKQSKRFGEKAFQNVDTTTLNHIGKVKKATKVFDNLSTLDVKQIPEALNFFPNNLNTNVIWLGMDFGDNASDVLISSQRAIKKYNDVLSNTELLIQITDTEQTVVNKANALLRYDKLTNAERIALLREMNIGNSTIQKNTVFIRLNQGYYPDLTVNTKEFAWVTDPYILMGKGEIKELMEGIGYSYDDAIKAKKLYMDVIIFDKPENVKKLIEPQIIDWDKIRDITYDKLSKKYEEILKMPDVIKSASITDFNKKYPNLISNNKVDKTLLEQNYIKYYRVKLPGVKLEGEAKFKSMTKFFNDEIGASEYFSGAGVTVSDKAGIGSNEFALINNDCNFNVEQINNSYPGTCHIVRLETNDTGMFVLKK